MRCKIISLERIQEFRGIGSVTLPVVGGERQILPGHAESFFRLGEGTIVLEGGGQKSWPVSGGVCYVKDDKILISL
jgi:F0F1-type ATP synthase epsilon subunit